MNRFQALRIALLIAAMSLVGPTACWARRGEVVLAPLDKNRVHVFSPGSGLRLTLNSNWYPDGGYLPVGLVIEARAASITDRRIEVSLHLLNTTNPRFSTTGDLDEAEAVVRRELVLPAGETELVTRVLCPTVAPSDRLGCRVLIDGVEDLALRSVSNLMVAGSRFGDAVRAYRPVDASPRSYPRQGQWFAVGARRNSWVAFEELQGERFDEWLAYTGADSVVLSLAELERLAEQKPDVLKPIRQWVLAGGSLWIEQADPGGEGAMETESLPKIDRLLGLEAWRFVAVGEESQKQPGVEDSEDGEDEAAEEPEAGLAVTEEATATPPGTDAVVTPDSATDESDSKQESIARDLPMVPIEGAPGWGYVAPKSPARAWTQAGRSLPAPQGPGQLELLQRVLQGGRSRPAEVKDSRDWFAQRDAGFGRVYAFRLSPRNTPAELRSPSGGAISNSWRRRAWTQRHGLEVGGRSNEFGNLLIPDVGVAPVNEFQVLITLFVLLVGPLNYWLLWRQRQLQLLVITAPLGALAVTLGLFAYAAVSDGFGVKARARSVTLLDQAAGQAASWSRVTHYAATAPSEPAMIPSDTAIYPVNPGWEGAFSTASSARTVDWTPEGQRLTSGWFPTRTAVQHLLVRSRTTEARLDFAGPDEKPSVVNRLGAPLELLLVRNEAGDWLAAEQVPAGEETPLDSLEYREAILKLRLIMIDNEPTYPIGAGSAIEQTLDRMGRSGDVRRVQRSLSTVSLDANLANRVLDRLGGLAGGATLDVPPRTYIAVTAEAVETPLGWEGVDEVGSFHVTLGRW